MTRFSARSAAFALVAIGALLWGTGGVAGSLVADNSDLSLLSVSAVRLLAGGALMFAVAAATALAILLLGQHLAFLTGAGIALLLAAVLLVREPAEEAATDPVPMVRQAEPVR